MSVHFDIQSVEQLRERGSGVMHVVGWQEAPAGWSLNAVELESVVAVFPSLQVRKAMRLVGYLFKDGHNGHGAVWAVEGKRGDCRIAACTLQPYGVGVRTFPRHAPRPPRALGHFMMAIEGDGTPASYVQASLLARTLAEFGAQWHGIRWSHEQILGDDPPYCEPSPPAPADARMPRPFHRNRGISRWVLPKPEVIAPTFDRIDNQPTIVMHTYSEFGNCHVTRVTDRYDAEGYTFETTRVTVAEGPEGYIF